MNLLHSMAAVFRIEIHRIFAARMFLFVGLVYALPPTIFLLTPTPVTPAGALLQYSLILYIYYQALIPLATLLYASSMIRDEQDQKTLGYLLLRPIPRWAILLSKYAACSTVMGALSALAILGCHLSFWVFKGAHLPAGYFHLPLLGWTIVIAWTSCLVFLAVFSVISAIFRRALVAGLIYGFFIEIVLSLVPAVVARISCMHYIRGLFLRPPFGDSSLNREIELGLGLFEIPTRGTAALSLLLVATVCLVLSSTIFTLREYAISPEN